MNSVTKRHSSKERASFSGFELEHGLLCDMKDNPFSTSLWAWRNAPLTMYNSATHFGYVQEGTCVISSLSGQFTLRGGMVFSVPGELEISGNSSGILISRHGYQGFFQIGGPIEQEGRLKYIDGCTDSLLIPPIMLGDPCLNLLYFPPGVNQTPHTHPSMRVGIVASGSGVCVTPRSNIPLIPGRAFVIHAEGVHSFSTQDGPMRVIAYHPDSDFGPTHQDHPMINRTIIEGRSASALAEIQTR